MQGIMFNERFGLESATLDGSKTRTTRNELDRKSKHSKEELNFINLLYNDSYMEHSGILEFDDVNTFTLKDFCSNFAQFKTRYKVGETIAIKQTYLTIKRPQYDKFGSDLAGNHNKMFVRNDLMPHHLRPQRRIYSKYLDRNRSIEQRCI